MTADERLRLTIGELIIINAQLAAEIERLQSLLAKQDAPRDAG